MPNYKVFQDLPSKLRTRLYGMDSGDDIAVVVDSSGVLAIQDNGGSITVDATDLDIRDLTEATDSIQIYGFDGTTNQAILTDASGRLEITVAPSFTEATEDVNTATAFVGSTSRDVSGHPNYTWFVHNTGATNTADVQLEISPDDTEWISDGAEEIVETETAIVVVSNVFLRYTRIAYKSTTAGSDTSLSLTWQAYN